jgi:sodium--glutamate symport carrier gltS
MADFIDRPQRQAPSLEAGGAGARLMLTVRVAPGRFGQLLPVFAKGVPLPGFLVVPLVGAFFIDLLHAIAIKGFIGVLTRRFP